MKIYRANILHTPTPDAFQVLERGYVVVTDDGRVDRLCQTLPEDLNAVPVTDFGDRLLIPAFNDLHVHAPQYRNMSLAMDLELLPWLETYTFPEEQRFADTAYAEHIYRRFVHELWMQGTMRAAVYATIHLDATLRLADLFTQAGLGAYVGLVGMDRNCPDYLSNTAEQVVQGTRRLAEHLRANPLVRPIITPRFVPSCSDTMLQQLGMLAHELQLPVQSHLSENLSEIEWVRQLHSEASSYGEVYYQKGLFGQTPTLMAHCCYTQGEELELIRQNGVYVVHCPMSNSNLSSGIAPIRTFMEQGVKVALGTDVSAGHNMSMLRVMQYAIQVSKLRYAESHRQCRFLSLSEVFYLATKGGGSFFGRVGAFEPGYDFDALVVDDSYLNFDNYTVEQRLERYIYLGDDRDIRCRFCAGRQVPEPRF